MDHITWFLGEEEREGIANPSGNDENSAGSTNGSMLQRLVDSVLFLVLFLGSIGID